MQANHPCQISKKRLANLMHFLGVAQPSTLTYSTAANKQQYEEEQCIAGKNKN